MDISIRKIGKYLVEMTIEDHGNTLLCDITDREGEVSPDFIQNLRDIADELEEHNIEKQ